MPAMDRDVKDEGGEPRKNKEQDIQAGDDAGEIGDCAQGGGDGKAQCPSLFPREQARRMIATIRPTPSIARRMAAPQSSGVRNGSMHAQVVFGGWAQV